MKHLDTPIIFWLIEICVLSVDLLNTPVKRVEVTDIWVIELNSNTSSGFSNISCISYSGVLISCEIILLEKKSKGNQQQQNPTTPKTNSENQIKQILQTVFFAMYRSWYLSAQQN